jgi:hypothetical protein
MKNDTTYTYTSRNRSTGPTSVVHLLIDTHKTQQIMKAKMITQEQVKKQRILGKKGDSAIFTIKGSLSKYVMEWTGDDYMICLVHTWDENRALITDYQASIEKITEKTFRAASVYLGKVLRTTIKFSDCDLIDYVDEATFNQKEKEIERI